MYLNNVPEKEVGGFDSLSPGKYNPHTFWLKIGSVMWNNAPCLPEIGQHKLVDRVHICTFSKEIYSTLYHLMHPSTDEVRHRHNAIGVQMEWSVDILHDLMQSTRLSNC